ncbi:nuclear polyadenylated RNA-binding protein 3 [Meyerozyma guilliermondii]
MVQHMEGTPQSIDNGGKHKVHIASESTSKDAPLTESVDPEANDMKIDEVELRLESYKTAKESSELLANSGSDSDDDYDPETAFTSTQISADNTINDGEKSVIREPQNNHIQANADEKYDDSYDPEATLPVVRLPFSGSGLPPRPIIPPEFSRIDVDPHIQFRAAYEAVMRSKLVKSKEFQALSELDQKKTILGELVRSKVKLVAGLTPEKIDRMNYDQIYSFNEPALLWNHTIPLIPYNEYCRRPNLTIPMSADEELAYNEFLKHQESYTSSIHRPSGDIRLFVGNLPATVSAKDLYRIFSQYGKLHEVTNRSLFAFIHFHNEADCKEAIKGEHDVPLFGRYWRLNATPAFPGKKYSEAARGRERSVEETPPGMKRQKVDVKEQDVELKQQKTNDGPIQCQIFVTNESSGHNTAKLKQLFIETGITFQVEDIEDEDLSELISEVAYSGVRSACIVKEHAVDLQVFEKTNDDGIRFDEYAGIEPTVAVEVIQNSSSKSTTVEPEPAPEPASEPASEPAPQAAPQPAPQTIYQSIKKDRGGNDTTSRVRILVKSLILLLLKLTTKLSNLKHLRVHQLGISMQMLVIHSQINTIIKHIRMELQVSNITPPSKNLPCNHSALLRRGSMLHHRA